MGIMEKTSLISSRSNPLIKQVRQLHQRKARRESGLFLVEGIHHVGEAFEAGWEIDSLIYAPAMLSSEFANRLVERISRSGKRCIAIPADIFTEIADKENPQGIIAVLHQRTIGFPEVTPQDVPLGVAVVSPQDPGNVGTILRTMDAVGADGLFLLDGGVDPYHSSSIRASMGAIFWKKVVQGTFEQFIAWVKKNNYALIGSSAHTRQDYRSFHIDTNPSILLLGSEQKGLSQEQLAACEVTVSIPMQGRASSLNLAVAAGILMYSLSTGD
jgi:RNA methyltransferase, TrmH family